MVSVELQSFQEIVNLEGCEAEPVKADRVGDEPVTSYVWPCGMVVNTAWMTSPPGVAWRPIRDAHQRHHDLGHVSEGVWMLLVTTETGPSWYKETFECACGP